MALYEIPLLKFIQYLELLQTRSVLLINKVLVRRQHVECRGSLPAAGQKRDFVLLQRVQQAEEGGAPLLEVGDHHAAEWIKRIVRVVGNQGAAGEGDCGPRLQGARFGWLKVCKHTLRQEQGGFAEVDPTLSKSLFYLSRVPKVDPNTRVFFGSYLVFAR